MKKLKKIAYFLFACLFLISSFSATVFASTSASTEELKVNEIYYPENYSGYKYPVHTEMSKWAKIVNHQDMVNACQIPKDALKNMSTSDLVQSVLSYPLNIDMFAYSTYSEGFEVVSDKFNGLKELKNRSDASSELLKQYLMQDTAQITELDQETVSAFKTQGKITSEQGKKAIHRIFNIMTAELLLSQPVFLDRFTEDETNSLIKGYKEKQSQINAKFGQTEESSVLINSINQLKSTSGGNISAAASTLYQGYLGGILCTFYITNVTTPTGVSVEVYDVQNEYTSAQKTSINNQNASAYPNATKLREPTVKYNCHSYAWYNSSTSKYWMNSPFNYYGGSNPSYSEKSTPTTSAKVCYWTTSQNPSNKHSGIVTSVSSGTSSKYYVDKITVKSKWGGAGLYQHAGTHCPYWYDDTSIRTRYYK